MEERDKSQFVCQMQRGDTVVAAVSMVVIITVSVAVVVAITVSVSAHENMSILRKLITTRTIYLYLQQF